MVQLPTTLSIDGAGSAASGDLPSGAPACLGSFYPQAAMPAEGGALLQASACRSACGSC